ncbi:MAG: Rrf2 family transcriptional regulator [candidate division KSB1 bacterium]
MPVVFSRACEYALRALFEMARHPEQENWTVQELARRTDTPAPFLAKTFQLLVKGEVLNSSKGRMGGFTFMRKPDKITLMEVVDIIDGPSLSKDCALGLPSCNEKDPCFFHSYWKGIRETIMAALRNESLVKVAREKKSPRKLLNRKL